MCLKPAKTMLIGQLHVNSRFLHLIFPKQHKSAKWHFIYRNTQVEIKVDIARNTTFEENYPWLKRGKKSVSQF